MKNLSPVSPGLRTAASFVLFFPTALFLLAPPLAEHFAMLHSKVPLGHAADLTARLLCVFFLILLGGLTHSLRNHLPSLLTSCILLAFILFFAMERALGYAMLSARFLGRAQSLPGIQLFSATSVAILAALVLPRLRSIMEGSSLVRIEHDKFLASAESSLDDFYIFDGIPDTSGQIIDFRFTYLNPNAERRLNTSRENLIGKVLTEVRPFMISSGLIESYREVVRTGRPFTGEVFIDDDMIKATWINVQVVKLGNGIAITSRDVTERKRLADHAHYLAHYDQLTGLANRTLLQDRLDQAIRRAQRQNHKVAVFMLDIDHFKRINDSLGHIHGDALLSAIGQRLVSCVRETDTIARLGGDEFVIVVPDFNSLEDLKRCGQEIVQRAALPVTIDNRQINITVSVGLAIYPDSGLEPQQLLKCADDAMYTIKDTGRNGLHIFVKRMIESGANNRAFE